MICENSAKLNLGAAFQDIGNIIIELRRFAYRDVDFWFRKLYLQLKYDRKNVIIKIIL